MCKNRWILARPKEKRRKKKCEEKDINFTKTTYNNETICLLVMPVLVAILFFQSGTVNRIRTRKKQQRKIRKKTTPVIRLFVHISRSFYFHHIFQSHAEYLDYLNRFFASIFFSSLLFASSPSARSYVELLTLFPSIEESQRKTLKMLHNDTDTNKSLFSLCRPTHNEYHGSLKSV